MVAVPRTTIDITYSDLNILRLMPGCSELVIGWNIDVDGKTYLVTTPDGRQIRCQMWTIPDARARIIEACQINN